MRTTERMPWDGKNSSTLLTAHTFINFNPSEKKGLLIIHQDAIGGWEAVINETVLPVNKDPFAISVFLYQWSEDEQGYKFFSGRLKRIKDVSIDI